MIKIWDIKNNPHLVCLFVLFSKKPMKFKNLHSWNLSYQKAIAVQKQLAKQVKLKNGFSKIRTIAGADIAIDSKKKEGIAGIIIFSYPEMKILEMKSARKKIKYPYIPGLLSFRESPLLLSVLKKVNIYPDLIMFDGQGIAHPKGLGIASHLGLILNKPTIGCAKSLLVGKFREPGKKQGSFTDLFYKGKKIGSAVRTRDGVKPVFISPGHKIGFKTSVKIALNCCQGCRIPEPTRQADIYVEKVKREFSK